MDENKGHRGTEEEQLAKIGRQAAEVVEQVAALGESVGVGVAGLKRRTGRHSKVLWLLGGSFAFDIILTLALVFTGAEVVRNSDELEQVQKVTNQDVLCPLYEIFVAASKAPPPPPNPGENEEMYKKRMIEREHNLKVVADGYNALECKKP